MFFSASMRKVDLIVMSKHIDAVTRTLGHLGVMHLVNTLGEHPAPGIAADNSSEEILKYEALGKRVLSLLHKTDIPEEGLSPIDETRSITDYSAALDLIERDLAEIDARIGDLNQRRIKIEAEILEFNRISFINIDLDRFLHLEYAQVVLGTCAAGPLEVLKQKLGDKAIVTVTSNVLGQEKILLFFSRKNKWAVSDELSQYETQEQRNTLAIEPQPTISQ